MIGSVSFGKSHHEDITVEEFSMRDDNAMSNYFVAVEVF